MHKNRLPTRIASVRDVLPLGIGLSGRSIASISASNTSLKITPPPYKPVVDNSSHASDDKLSDPQWQLDLQGQYFLKLQNLLKYQPMQ